MATASTLITRATNITKIDKDTIGIPGLEDTQLLSIVDMANRQYVNKFRLGGGEPLPSQASETGGTLTATTTLSANVTTATTEVTVASAANAESGGGAAIIWDQDIPDVIEYGSSDQSTTLSTVTGIAFSHESGDEVQFIPALPSNFASFRSTHDSPDGVLVEGSAYTFTSDLDVNDGNFSIYDNGTTKYIVFPRGLTGDYFVRYNRTSTTIDELTDSVDTPLDDEYFIVYRLVEHINRVLGLDTQEPRALADKILRDGLKRRNTGKRIKPGRRYEVGAEAFDIHFNPNYR